MPNQADIQQTILNAEYKLGTLVNTNYTRIQGGKLAIKEAYLNWFSLNIMGLIYQFDIADYYSNTTVVIYDRLNGLIGIPYGATVDPYFQAPNTTLIVTLIDMAQDLPYNENDLIDAGGGNWYLPFIDKSKPTPYPPVPSNYRPTVVVNNGESFTETWSKNFSPWRLYGFGNNTDTQNIVVTVVKTL